MQHLGTFSQAMFGTGLDQLAPEDFATMLETLRQESGQIGNALAGPDSEVNPWAAAASVYQEIGQTSFERAVGGGDRDGLRRAALLGRRMTAGELLTHRGRGGDDSIPANFRAFLGNTPQRPGGSGGGSWSPGSRSGSDLSSMALDVNELHAALLAEGRTEMARQVEVRVQQGIDGGWIDDDTRNAIGRDAAASLGRELNVPQAARDALGELYSGGRALQGVGVLAGVNARASGTQLDEILRAYADDSAPYGSEEEAMAAIRAYMWAGDNVSAGDLRGAFEGLKESFSGDEAALRRIERMEAGTLRGNRVRNAPVDNETLDDLAGALQGNPGAQELLGNRIVEQRGYTQDELMAGGLAVAEDRAADSLGAVRRNYLDELAGAGVMNSFTVGENEYNARDFRRLVSEGGVSIEQANSIYKTLVPEDLVSARDSARAEGDMTRAGVINNILRMRQGLPGGDGGQGSYAVLQGMVSSVIGSGGQISPEDIAMFSGLPGLHSNLTLVSQIQSTGNASEDYAILEQMFGSEENLGRFLSDAQFEGGSVRERAAAFSAGLENGALSGDQMSTFMNYLSSTFVLGENEKRDMLQTTRAHNQAQFYERMNNLLAGGDGIPVFVVGNTADTNREGRRRGKRD